MTMITLEEDARTTANTRATDRAGIGNGSGVISDTGAAADGGLLATIGSRLHCRTPMKRVDLEEVSVLQPVRSDCRTGMHTEKGPAPEGVATYRCRCGFTMDVPTTPRDYAVAG